MRARLFAPAAACVLAAALLNGCGEDDEPEATQGVVSVAEVVREGPALGEVEVVGTGIALPGRGFLLSGPDETVYVDALPSEGLKVDDGDELRITGTVDEIEPFRARWVRDALRKAGETVSDDIDPRAVTAPGRPYVDLDSLSGEETPPPAAKGSG